MGELEVIVENMRKDPNITEDQIRAVIEEYESSKPSLNTAVSETTGGQTNNPNFKILDNQSGGLEDDFDLEELLGSDERVENQVKNLNLNFSNPNYGGKGLYDADAERNKIKKEIKKTSVLDPNYNVLKEKLDEIRTNEATSQFSNLDYKAVVEATNGKDKDIGGNYIKLGEIGADVRENIKKFETKGPNGYSKREVYDAAIANMKVDNVSAGLGNIEDRTINTDEFEDWELLDGLDFEDIQRYAGIKYNAGADHGVIKKDSFSKKDHLNRLALKKYKLENKVVNERAKDVITENESLEEETTAIMEEGKSLETKLSEFKGRFDPVQQKYKMLR